MAKNKNEEKLDKKTLSGISSLNKSFQSLIGKITPSSLTNSIKNDDELDSMNRELDVVLGKERSILTKYTGNDITTMLNKLISGDNQGNISSSFGNKNIYELFENEIGGYGLFYYDKYRNINNKYDDLRIITDYLYEMDEVISTIRDNLICADDLGATISRQLTFGTKTEDDTNLVSKVEAMENKYKLKSLIKNCIYPGTLTYGVFYVYTIPYAKLFSLHEARKENGTIYGTKLNEATDTDFVLSKLDEIKKIVTESTSLLPGEKNTVSYKEITSDIKSICENIEVINSPLPLMEDSSLQSILTEEGKNEIDKFISKVKKSGNNNPDIMKNENTGAASKIARHVGDIGVYDTKVSAKTDKKYAFVKGTYIKTFSPGRIIPVKILDYTIGYYVIYESFAELENNMIARGSLNRMNMIYQQDRQKRVNDNIVDIIASKIVQSIDKSFVRDNLEFKELLVNAIAHDDLYKKPFKVQYIPAEYMTEFKVNENPDTKIGESVLSKSLFYAKLYLCILIFKIIAILTRSNDTKIYYIKDSGLKKNVMNRVNETAKKIKSNQINWNDMSSVNTLLNKVGKNMDIFMPVGRSNERSMEFEILSGQDVQLNTELMEFLRKNMVNNSGVPSVMLSYMEEVDYARTITMQHSKYLSRIISWQEELEVPTTELYRKLMVFDEILPIGNAEQFNYKLSRPKALNVQNMSDLISNAENTAAFLCRTLVGDTADDNLKDKVTSYIIKKILLSGVYDWDSLEKMLDSIKIEIQKDGIAKTISDNNENDNGGY